MEADMLSVFVIGVVVVDELKRDCREILIVYLLEETGRVID
jgi:hypothetical protein